MPSLACVPSYIFSIRSCECPDIASNLYTFTSSLHSPRHLGRGPRGRARAPALVSCGHKETTPPPPHPRALSPSHDGKPDGQACSTVPCMCNGLPCGNRGHAGSAMHLAVTMATESSMVKVRASAASSSDTVRRLDLNAYSCLTRGRISCTSDGVQSLTQCVSRRHRGYTATVPSFCIAANVVARPCPVGGTIRSHLLRRSPPRCSDDPACDGVAWFSRSM